MDLSMDAANVRAANVEAGASITEASAADVDSESEMEEDVGEANAEVVAAGPDVVPSVKIEDYGYLNKVVSMNHLSAKHNSIDGCNATLCPFCTYKADKEQHPHATVHVLGNCTKY
jgi:hypothetical protein